MTSLRITEEAKAQFERQGYCIVQKGYEDDELQEINREYFKIWIELLAAGKIRQNPQRPLESLYPNRLRDFHRGNETITKFMLKPAIIQLLEACIGEEPLAIQSNYYYKPPGAKGLGFHQDNSHIGIEPDTSYAVWTSIDPSDEENGSLLFVPGTHKLELSASEVVPGSSNAFGSELQRKPAGYDTVQIRTSPGDVVIFHGNLYHGSSKNRSEYRYRRSFVAHFARAGVEKISLNYSYLLNKEGKRIRKKLNPHPKIIEAESSIFQYKDASYFDQIIKGM